MIDFPPIRTGRLNVQLRELTIREAIQVAAVPPQRHESAVDRLLSAIVERSDGPAPDPAAWTVQERMFAVAHYIACTSEEGGNFSIGSGRLLDYLTPERDAAPESAEVGEAEGDLWHMRQLTGAEALVMEGMCSTLEQWHITDMAARLYVPGSDDDNRPSPHEKPGDFAVWLMERREVFLNMPEHSIEALFGLYGTGRAALHHLFWLGFDESGHTALPSREGGDGDGLSPARFPALSCVGRLARWLGAGRDRAGGLP